MLFNTPAGPESVHEKLTLVLRLLCCGMLAVGMVERMGAGPCLAMAGAGCQEAGEPSASGSATGGDPLPAEAEPQTPAPEFGYLRAVLANGKSLVRGDCLIRSQMVWDSVDYADPPNLDGALIQLVLWTRLRFDFETNRFLMVRSYRNERTDLDRLEGDGARREGPVAQSWVSGMIVRDNRKFFFLDGRPAQSPPGEEEEERPITDDPGFVDLRTPGWDCREDCPLSQMEKGVGYLETLGSPIFAREGKDGLVLEIFVQVPDRKKHAARILVTLDSRTLMPVQVDSFMSIPEHANYQGPETEARLGGPCRMQWELAECGTHVVKRIENERVSPGTAYGRSEMGQWTSVTDIHWFLVNHPLDDDAFDERVFLSSEETLKLIDPAAQGAKTFLPRCDDSGNGTGGLDK